jgi:hypothetical protein
LEIQRSTGLVFRTIAYIKRQVYMLHIVDGLYLQQ